jgi:predicted ArsR family transcriptional regulator
VFSLTDAGLADFYSAYDDIAIQALEFLAEQAGPDAVTKFAASRTTAAEGRYRDSLAVADPDLTPAQALAGALSADGYVASVRPSALGEQLCQHHCPVAHVAEKFPQLCEVETELFSRLLGVHVQRLATIAHGDGVCTTHIPGSARVPNVTPTGDASPVGKPNNELALNAVLNDAARHDPAAPAAPETNDHPAPPVNPRERPFS